MLSVVATVLREKLFFSKRKTRNCSISTQMRYNSAPSNFRFLFAGVCGPSWHPWASWSWIGKASARNVGRCLQLWQRCSKRSSDWEPGQVVLPPGRDLQWNGLSFMFPFYRQLMIKFRSLGQAMEECRAEACGLYLCDLAPLLAIFGYEGSEALDVTYVNWLTMARKGFFLSFFLQWADESGLQALEFYSPETKQWRQAHMHARFALFNVMLRAGENFVQIDESGFVLHAETLSHFSDLPVVILDREKISTVGRPAIGQFLLKMSMFSTMFYFISESKWCTKVQPLSRMLSRCSMVGCFSLLDPLTSKITAILMTTHFVSEALCSRIRNLAMFVSYAACISTEW